MVLPLVCLDVGYDHFLPASAAWQHLGGCNMDLKKQLSAVASALNARFTLNGKPISHDEVFADNGLLPALAKRAD